MIAGIVLCVMGTLTADLRCIDRFKTSRRALCRYIFESELQRLLEKL